jgi:hypothetical protein
MAAQRHGTCRSSTRQLICKIVLNGSQALHAITSADLRDTTTPNYALRLSSRDITLASIGHRELHQ